VVEERKKRKKRRRRRRRRKREKKFVLLPWCSVWWSGFLPSTSNKKFGDGGKRKRRLRMQV